MKAPKRLIALLTILALAIPATAALARDEGTGAVEDTQQAGKTHTKTYTLNYGYDAVNGVFVWSLVREDGTLECGISPGLYNVKYVTIDGRFYVDDILGTDGTPVTFPVKDDPTAEPVPYAVDGECALKAAVVASPDNASAQGKVARVLAKLADPGQKGCILRTLARLGFGKQKLERIAEDGEITLPEVGQVDIDSIEVECRRWRDRWDDDDVRPRRFQDGDHDPGKWHGRGHGKKDQDRDGRGQGKGNSNGNGRGNGRGNGGGNGR